MDTKTLRTLQTMSSAPPRKKNKSNRERVNRREALAAADAVAAHHAWLGGKHERNRRRNRARQLDRTARIKGTGSYRLVKPVFA